MNLQTTTVAIGVLFAFAAPMAQAEPAGAAFSGNEAVRVVNGKRLVELPPLTKAAQRFVSGGGKFPPPSAVGEVFMIEGPDALVECSIPYLSKSACVSSSLGVTKRPRFWTVKLSGSWVHCGSRTPSRVCEPLSAGVPGGLSAVE